MIYTRPLVLENYEDEIYTTHIEARGVDVRAELDGDTPVVHVYLHFFDTNEIIDTIEEIVRQTFDEDDLETLTDYLERLRGMIE